MSVPAKHSLAELVDLVEAGLADAERAAGTYADDPHGWHRRHRGEMTLLSDRLTLEVGAQVRHDWHGARVRINGIASSSTSGVAGALRNWLTAARKRLENA